eukprot:8371437-Alexandrium_andersonii.AAC.1
MQVLGMELVEPVGEEPGGVLKDARHAPGGRVRGDEEGGRGVPLVPVGLLQVAVNPEEERGDQEERIADLPGGDDRPLEQA